MKRGAKYSFDVWECGVRGSGGARRGSGWAFDTRPVQPSLMVETADYISATSSSISPRLVVR